MRKSVALIACAILVLLPASALAHASLESSDPEVDSTVDKAPPEVTLTMAEQPAAGSSVTVTDGCKKEVGEKAQLSGNDMVVAIDGGQPGRWNVDFVAISAEDGHELSDSFSFVVAGQKDCNAKPTIEPSTSSTKPINNPDDGSSFPVVPLVIGTVVVVGGALLLRRSTSGS
ncbi:MAG: CopC domain [Actinomycetota bacterium]|nr:CopC domain [Actinomycetota bacterium]